MTVKAPERRKRVRLEDVARRVKISIGTASMAIRGSTRISARTRQRVLQACRDLGYRRPLNANGSASRSGAQAVVSLLLVGHGVHDLVNAELLHVLSSTAHVRQFRLDVQTVEAQIDDDHEMVRLIRDLARRSTGVLLSGDITGSVLHRLDQAHVRAAMLGWPIVNEGESADAPPAGVVIAGDDQAMGRRATEHLLASGYRRVAFLAGQLPITASQARWLEGYRLALAGAGIDFDDRRVRVAGGEDGPGVEVIRALLQIGDATDAFVVTEARVAALLRREFEARGRSDADRAMVVWTNEPQARLYGVADVTSIGIDPYKWVQAGLGHVLGSDEQALPVGSRVLVPFVSRHMQSASREGGRP